MVEISGGLNLGIRCKKYLNIPPRGFSAEIIIPCPRMGSFREASLKANESVASPCFFLNTVTIPISKSAAGKDVAMFFRVNVAAAEEDIATVLIVLKLLPMCEPVVENPIKYNNIYIIKR